MRLCSLRLDGLSSTELFLRLVEYLRSEQPGRALAYLRPKHAQQLSSRGLAEAAHIGVLRPVLSPLRPGCSRRCCST